MCSSKSLTKMAETPKSTRRSNKPLMERRRRERINHCLNELKNLVLTAQKKDPTRYSKLEKADILEMTVRHVQDLHRQDTSLGRSVSSSPMTDSTAKYNAGFRKCASEVSRFLSGVNGLPNDLHARVLSHLGSSTNAEYPVTKRSLDSTSPTKYPHGHHQQHCPKHSSQRQSQGTGMPVVDARLSSGQFQALVSPSWTGSSISGSPPTNATSPEAAGAPSSPESARGSPNMTSPTEEAGYDCPQSSEKVSAIKFHPKLPSVAHSSIHCTSFSKINSTYSSTKVCLGRMQVDLQVAPLDLATSHRRCATTATSSPKRHRAITVPVEAASPQQKADESLSGPNIASSSSNKSHQLQNVTFSISKSVGHHHSLKDVRHAPYPVQNLQNPHWRPW